MRASILTIGDELLIGQVLNSNVQWMGEQLTEIGCSVGQQLTVGDHEHAIRGALQYLAPLSDVILIGGGLGPTHDDITLEVLSKQFRIPLEYDAEWISRVDAYFKARGRVMSDNNKKQGHLLKTATRIDNDCGTAAGQFFEQNKIQYFVFPGVPHEMKSMMTRFILPHLQKQQLHSGEKILKQTLLTTGAGESLLAERCDPFVQKIKTLPHVTLAFLPSSTQVRLRLQMRASTPAQEQQFVALVSELKAHCGPDFFGFDPTTIEQVILTELAQAGHTLAIAESCTGGYVTHRLTQIPGASTVLRGALVPYQEQLKISELEIPAALIETRGVVSEQVVTAMAESIRRKWGTDFGIATTGFLGPTGGDAHAEVGTVWVAVASKAKTTTKMLKLEAHRERAKERAAQAALDMLRREIGAKTILNSR